MNKVRLTTVWSRLVLAFGLILVVTLALALVGYTQNQALAQSTQSATLRLTTDTSADVRPVLSPDGKTVAFQSNRGGQTGYHIWVMDVDGQNQRQITKTELDERHPFWSPDGQRIAFDAYKDGIREIWVMNRDGSNRRQVTKLGADSHFPAYSPDGKSLSFYVFKEGVLGIWVIGEDGSNPRPLVPKLAETNKGQCTFACHQAMYSPDGKRIAYTGGDHRSIWYMDADGANQKQIRKLDPQEHQHFPWWLQDGQLAYIVETINAAEAYTDAWVVNVPDGTPELLQARMAQQGPMEWATDFTRVYFHSPRAGNFDIYSIDLTTPAGIEALQGAGDAFSSSGHPGGLPSSPAGSGAQAPPAPSTGGSSNTTSAPAPVPASEAAASSPLLSPLMWVLAGLGGLFVLGALALVIFVVFLQRRRPTRR